MAKRMLIDATHPEETRVVVLNGTRLEEFDFETSTKRQIKGNIYLAKVTRVEPSLQAAFVEYGGNRHGFLAFSEIHPDYYRIPISDREAMQADERPARGGSERNGPDRNHSERNDSDQARGYEAPPENGNTIPQQGAEETSAPVAEQSSLESDQPYVEFPIEPGEPASIAARISNDVVYAPPQTEAPGRNGDHYHDAGQNYGSNDQTGHAQPGHADDAPLEQTAEGSSDFSGSPEDLSPDGFSQNVEGSSNIDSEVHLNDGQSATDHASEAQNSGSEGRTSADDSGFIESRQVVETLGGDEIEEDPQQPGHHHHYRHYKVQEVIKRRQILLIQVTKEERGNKGAALTTYLSLAGRYCVLMPNAGRGGGVSRKITSPIDRRRLKDLMEELQVPDGMGVIVRTAGSERSKAEIHRDYEYLLRLWDEIRELTLRSSAPALIYEEGNLIKRAIRDLYSRDIEEILVEGEEGYRTARGFMKMLVPSQASQVKPYRDPTVPLFHRYQVDTQIDQIHNPIVQLRSGGYIVINPTEALVAIDVNSGRSTRERNIEETAAKTNLEAADEIARQLRLRDLAGLIVIDFIDMEEGRNQASVERRLKDAMRNDRARIQIGRISPFGLLELSRQRLRSSLIEASTQPCPHCNGTGAIRSTESAALVVLRALEEEGIRRRTAEITILVHSNVAFYILNQKRDVLSIIERRYGFSVTIDRDDTLVLPAYRLDRMRVLTPAEIATLEAVETPPMLEDDFQDEAADFEEAEAEAGDEPETAETNETAAAPQNDGQPRRKKRRRKRRRSGEDQASTGTLEADATETSEDSEQAEGDDEEQSGTFEDAAGSGDTVRAAGDPGSIETAQSDEAERRRRRRGRRGGRRRYAEENAAGSSGELGYPPPEDFARDGREALFTGGDNEEERAVSHEPSRDPQPSYQEPGYQEPSYQEPGYQETGYQAETDEQPTAQDWVPSSAETPESAENSAFGEAPVPVTDIGEPAGVSENVASETSASRKPRSPRRKKTDGEDGTTSETKPRRGRRPRRSGSLEDQPQIQAPLDTAPAFVPEPELVLIPEVEPASRQEETKTVEETPPDQITETATPAVSEEAPRAPEPSQEADPSAPKRSGWWRRLVQ